MFACILVFICFHLVFICFRIFRKNFSEIFTFAKTNFNDVKVQFYLQKTTDVLTNIYCRIADSKRFDVKIKTPVTIYSDCWKNGKIQIPKIASKQKIQFCTEANKKITELQNYLFELLPEKQSLTTKEAKQIVNSYVLGRENTNAVEILKLYDKMTHERNLAVWTLKKYKTVRFVLETENEKQTLTTENFTKQKVFEILTDVKNGNRGNNAFCKYVQIIRTFCLWLHRNNYVKEYLLNGYELPREQYGTPYYLTTDEREQLANAVLPDHLAKQRDIFIFQCYIGCRVADLLELTKNNINGEFLEYIAEKTKKTPKVIKIPLAPAAKNLIAKYNDPGREQLFPFISKQKYNVAIKEAAKIAGLNRPIQKLNPRTGKKEFAPLWSVISSHCARRTFIGILYKKTKDVNVIASMSGHVENSRAFLRYRTIDDDDKRELINLL